MVDRFERFINLIGKTGDRLIIYDRHQPDDSFVLVNLKEYERLMSETKGIKELTEDELIDKINRDIALWKEGQVSEPPSQAVSSFPAFAEASAGRPPVSDPDTWESPTVENKPRPKGNSWVIPETRRHKAE